jgi:hypothetical protein
MQDGFSAAADGQLGNIDLQGDRHAGPNGSAIVWWVGSNVCDMAAQQQQQQQQRAVIPTSACEDMPGGRTDARLLKGCIYIYTHT